MWFQSSSSVLLLDPTWDYTFQPQREKKKEHKDREELQHKSLSQYEGCQRLL